MKCPVCDTKADCTETRPAKNYDAVIRRFECPECLTRFKSSEKVIFTSLPPYIRERFLNEGKRK